jgi:hypothetical protein
MDLLEKKILTSLYLSSLVPEISSYDRLWSGSHIPRDVYEQKILELSRKGLVPSELFWLEEFLT